MHRSGNSLLLTLTLVVAGGWGLAQGDNPVTNGGFEEVDEKGQPIEWSILGDVQITDDAHSGKNAVRLSRTEETKAVETGLNRAWEPFGGEQGTMLDRLSGGIVFWYKALEASDDATLDVYAIPMSDKPLEDTGSPRAGFRIPREHIGDGAWRQARFAYSFTDNPNVKWVHISPRLLGKSGVLLLDDFTWVEKTGPILVVTRIEFTEDTGAPGDRAKLAVTIRNTGDVGVETATIDLELPEGLRVDRGVPAADIKDLEPGSEAKLSWQLVGRREKEAVIRVAGQAGETPLSAEYRIAPEVKVEQLETQRFILANGETTTLSCWIENTGHAIAGDIAADLEVPDGFSIAGGAHQALRALRPGQKQALTWRATAKAETMGGYARAMVTVGNAKGGEAETFLMATAAPTGTLPVATGAGVNNQMAMVGNESVRLIFRRSSYGYGVAELYVRGTGGFHFVGRMPRLGRLVLQGAEGNEDHLLFADNVEATGNKLAFTKELKDASGGTWQFGWTFGIEPGANSATFTMTAQCSQEKKVLALEGPMLYVGEGAFGIQKAEAIFPGLEWLVLNERSSNDLEIKAEHAERIRYVPHPNKITIPLMSVYHNGLTVGLLWDHRQKWDGTNDRPSAVFASPDYFEGKQAHLMGLFLPSGTKWVRENNRLASSPYELPAATVLKLEARIFAKAPTTDALAAMDEWFKLYGVPEPNPIPRGSYRDEISFSMQAYLKSLWVEEEETWWTSRGAGPLLSTKGLPASFVYDLLMGAMLSSEDEVRTACRALAERVMTKHAIKPASDDMGLRFGSFARPPVDPSAVASLVDSMGPDGAWRFDADRVDTGIFKGLDYHELGPDNAAEVGTCARNAYEILRYAVITGDDQAYLAATKTLEFMKQFIAPRAAQVWEVPVHAPDILAAADAVDAYLMAYIFSSDEQWLAEARRWARAGLPFVYLWNDESQPFVLYASIPVFGASWNQWSWFGRPVQWNGLRYARAVTRLAQYDAGFPWAKVGEGIARSALYQQSTNEDDIALWPDSIGAVDGMKAGWVFAPQLILWNVYGFMGYQPDPSTEIVRIDQNHIHITAAARLFKGEFAGSTLSFRLRYSAGDHGVSLVSGVTEPTDVVVNGEDSRRADSADSLISAEESRWYYWPDSACLLIWFHNDGRKEVRIEGIALKRISLLPVQMTTPTFEFSMDTAGFSASHDLSPLAVENGVLKLRAMGPDPYMIRPRMSFAGNSAASVVVCMRTTASGVAQFYWTTQDSPSFAEDKVAQFELTPGDDFVEYRIPVGDNPMWRGHTITGIRLDFCNGRPDASAEVDYIRGAK